MAFVGYVCTFGEFRVSLLIAGPESLGGKIKEHPKTLKGMKKELRENEQRSQGRKTEPRYISNQCSPKHSTARPKEPSHSRASSPSRAHPIARY